MNEENDSKTGLDELYHDYWTVHNEKMANYTPLEVAAILITQGLSIYKTVLSEDNYESMIEGIVDSKDQIKEIPNPMNSLH